MTERKKRKGRITKKGKGLAKTSRLLAAQEVIVPYDPAEEWPSQGEEKRNGGSDLGAWNVAVLITETRGQCDDKPCMICTISISRPGIRGAISSITTGC